MKSKFMIAMLSMSVLLGIALSACSPASYSAGNSTEDAEPTVEQESNGEEAEKNTEPGLSMSDSGVEGYLWIGPACPVVKLGTECPDLPYEAEFTVTDIEGEIMESGNSDESGFFRILLPPGSYIFVPAPSKPAISPRANPAPFDVDAGAFTHLEVTYDSGLR